jgi:phospholipid/cholesterol/gamma-HCH transport system substrate-binding protein
MAELEIRPTPTMIWRVAGVILSAMAMAAVLVWLLTGGGVGLFAQKVDMKTYMPDATGLQADAPVRMNGIQVGSVRNIAVSGYLDSQRAVRVALRVDASFLTKIPVDSLTSIGSDTLVGDKFVDIAAGKSAKTVGDGSELPSEPAESAADKADLIYGLQDSLKKVDSMLADIASPDTPIGHYVVGEKEYGQMLRSIDAFEKNMRDLVARGNPTGDAVFSTSLYSQWDHSLRQLDDSMQAIQKGQGVAGSFYASDDQYTKMLSQVRDIRKSLGTIHEDMVKAGPGLRDEETYRKITRMLASADSALAALNRGEGAAGDLLTNPQLYESLVGSLANLQKLVADFQTHPQKYLRVKAFGK